VKVELVASSPGLAGRPEPTLPEFAFIGRSNCGKSSLINHILGRVGMARISGKPGKTRLLHYYLVSDKFYLVDLPGYGYAKVSKTQRAAWRKLFQAFLSDQERPLAVVQLLDARQEPSVLDREVCGWIMESGHPQALAATKIDKVGATRRAASYRSMVETLGVDPQTPFFPTSAVQGIGRTEILAWIDAMITANTEETEETGDAGDQGDI